MQGLVGLIRTEHELREALKRIESFKHRASRTHVDGGRTYNPGWHIALDLASLLTVAECCTLAALEPRERRGGHPRDDHPYNDLACRWNCKAGKCGSCSAEINGKPRLMCMTRMDLFQPGDTITVAPIRTFPLIRDLVTDVSFNYEKAKQVPPLRLKPPEADGTYRMMQADIDRMREFHKCIECFLCQD